VFIVRMMAGRSPFSPDKNHVHHRILAMGFQQISTVILLALLNLVVILFVINFAALGNTILIGALVVFSILLSVFLGVYRSRSAEQRVAS
jgi:UDP-GlcNAc:undecaprenyl-phosphate/decaprenyl-phosphate GlcNAc-1-phosphate transferase